MGTVEAVLSLLGPVLAAFGVFLVRGWVRGRRGASRLDQLARSGTATLPCRVRGDRPYPAEWAHARLVVRSGGAWLRMRERHLRDVRLPAGPVDVLHVRAAGQGDRVRTDSDDLVVVSAADGSGTRLHLLVPEETLEGAVELLERLGPLVGPATPVPADVERSWRRLVPTWCLATGGASLLLVLLVAGLWWASEPVEVRVTGPADEYDYCPVAWSDPWDGRPQDAQMSCWDEQRGDRLPGRALAAPFRGEIFDTDSFPALLLLVPLPLLVVTLAGVGRRAWQLRSARDRRQQTSDLAEPLGVVPDLPPLDADVLDVRTAAAAVAARSVRERWTAGPHAAVSAEEAESSPWWTLPTLRGVARAEAARASGALLAVVFALLGGWSAWGGWLGTQGEVQVARAAAGERYESPFLLPDDLEVTFTVDGEEVTALVAAVGEVPESGLRVVHSVEDPTRARILGPGDGTRRGMLLSGLLGGGALAWLAWCTRGLLAARREVLGALHDPRRARRDYVLTADPEGDPVLLLWTPRSTSPGWAVPLAEPVLGAVPLHGEVELRGDLRDGGAVLPVLPGRVLWPSSPVVELDRDDAVLLLTGAVPGDGDLESDEDRPPG
ncbi:MAG: hypothetical protein ACLGIV_06405 [Actinomycetes bacterium]